MTHRHSLDGVEPSKRRTLNTAALVLAAAIVTAMAVLWPSVDVSGGLGDLGFGSEFYDAEVLDIGTAPVPGPSRPTRSPVRTSHCSCSRDRMKAA